MAKKSLKEMLAENVKRQDEAAPIRRFAVFVSLWDEIQEAYREGWSYMAIWRAYDREGVIDFGYSTFRNFVAKKKRREAEEERERARAAQQAALELKTSTQPAATPPRGPGATKVDLPVFGQNVKPRDPKRF